MTKSTSAQKKSTKDLHTPMMQQYLSVKENYPDALVFYRMGDFYELFFEDAVQASKALDIALTKRGKTAGTDIPMCGVPAHAHESYLAKLIKAGFKVALCDQVETPEEAKARAKANGQSVSKALVKRDVIRVVTKGTLTEDSLLDAKSHNYLAAYVAIRDDSALAWLDISTGDFQTQLIQRESLPAALERITPSELLISDTSDETLLMHPTASILDSAYFNSESALDRLHKFYNVKTLDAFGDFSRAEVTAAGVLLDYVARTQIGAQPALKPLSQLKTNAFMEIDAATRRSLEILNTQTGEHKGSLISCIDRTSTSGGARLLRARLSNPSMDLDEIQRRHDQIETLLSTPHINEELQENLKQIPDIERSLSRLSLNRGGPRDLDALKNALNLVASLKSHLRALNQSDLKPFEGILSKLHIDTHLQAYLEKLHIAIATDLPVLSRDGNFIKTGFDSSLDKYRELKSNARQRIASLQNTYLEKTGINSLKITYNNILGYFIEVPPKHGNTLLVGANDEERENLFIHRQTLANSMRFTTPELSELERDISQASEKSIALEQKIFQTLVAQALENAPSLNNIAQSISSLDVAVSMAILAKEENYVRPLMTREATFEITQGRHPVVETALRKENKNSFVPNDCQLNKQDYIWLLTGPNMAGKSTYLRQNALIALLAQSGSFVPATKATIGLVDRLFSRVGASDDLASGRSTFMVEMVETAAILNQATQNSLVILDEIGRGTATYDGLSIAWATLEYLHEKTKCRTIFATHYHELTSLHARLSALSCHSMRVKEWQDDIIFLHEVGDGAADRSYGIHVAKLAGLPKQVLDRAKSVLSMLEKEDQSGALQALSQDLPLFKMAKTMPETPSDPLKDKIMELNPDQLSPKQALDLIYELKSFIKDKA